MQEKVSWTKKILAKYAKTQSSEGMKHIPKDKNIPAKSFAF